MWLNTVGKAGKSAAQRNCKYHKRTRGRRQLKNPGWGRRNINKNKHQSMLRRLNFKMEDVYILLWSVKGTYTHVWSKKVVNGTRLISEDKCFSEGPKEGIPEFLFSLLSLWILAEMTWLSSKGCCHLQSNRNQLSLGLENTQSNDYFQPPYSCVWPFDKILANMNKWIIYRKLTQQ